MDDELVRAYALEAQKAMAEEASRRIAEQTDAEEEKSIEEYVSRMLLKLNTSSPYYFPD